jgi:hypothetical protein
MLGSVAPLEGLKNSLAQFDQAAGNIARATLPPPGGQDIVELSAAAVSLLEARNNFEANTKLIKTMDEMDQALINSI